jgi:hypothetical protein
MEGTIITEELNMFKIEAGTICILKEKELLRLATVQHYSHDEHWVVTGTGFDEYTVPVDAMLCKLVVIADNGVYPLKFNQWKKAIQNGEVSTEKRVNFELIPAQFKEGKYIGTCNECTAQFLGGRNQPECKDCCDKDVTARIIINKSVKTKRPRLMKPEQSKEIALNAFKHGKDGLSNVAFVKWLEKQF